MEYPRILILGVAICAICGFGLVACETTACEDFCQQSEDCGVDLSDIEEGCVAACVAEQGEPEWECMVDQCTQSEDCSEMTSCMIGCTW